MKYHFKISQDSNRYFSKCVELNNCTAEGSTLEEIEKNMEEELNLFLSKYQKEMPIFPLPDNLKSGESLVEVKVNPQIAFGVILKHIRNKNNLTQAEAAQKIGFKSTYSYQKYEKKSNPRLSTINKIIKLFPDFPVELIYS